MAVTIEDYDDSMDWHTIGTKIFIGRWWVIATIVLSTSVFAAVAFLSRPTYRATAVLAPADPDRVNEVAGSVGNQLSGLAAVAGLSTGPRDAETEEALSVLLSREFADKFISELNLMPLFFPTAWDPVAHTWKADLEHRPTETEAFKYFDRKLRLIALDRKTGLFTLQIDWFNREQAAAWANELVRRINEEMRTRAIVRADAAIRFLERESQSTSTVEVRDAISRLMEEQVKERMLADVTPDYAFRVVDRAIVPDRDDPISPNKPLLLMAGPLVGLFAGLVLVACCGFGRVSEVGRDRHEMVSGKDVD